MANCDEFYLTQTWKLIKFSKNGHNSSRKKAVAHSEMCLRNSAGKTNDLEIQLYGNTTVVRTSKGKPAGIIILVMSGLSLTKCSICDAASDDVDSPFILPDWTHWDSHIDGSCNVGGQTV